MSWLQCLLYGFIMGISEFIPVSSGAQDRILRQLFGVHSGDYLGSLIVHICAFIAFLIAWRMPEELLSLTQYNARTRGRRNRGHAESQFIRSAIIPMLLIMLLSMYLFRNVSVALFIIFLLINGIVLYMPERLLQGNKTAKAMSVFDSWLIGAAGALSVIPGFSRIGMCVSVAQMRGADRKYALDWAYTLSVPALLLLIGADLTGILLGGQTFALSTGFLGYLLLAVSSFVGSYLSVYFVRNFILHRGLCAYAYYSWGCALFVFILYLL